MPEEVERKIVDVIFVMSNGKERKATKDELDSNRIPHNAEKIIFISADGTRDVRFIDGLGR